MRGVFLTQTDDRIYVGVRAGLDDEAALVAIDRKRVRGLAVGALRGGAAPRLAYEHVFAYARGMTDPYSSQRAVLGALLNAHPQLLDVDELAARLPDVPRVREALRVLVDDGLATRLGDRVGVSRAAARFNTLAQV